MFNNVNDLANLQEMLKGGYISQRHHPEFKLNIFNYTSKTQYDRVWNEATIACRGLICTEDGRIISRPFRKFFNLEEMESLPDEPFEITEKMDGSLGISYYWNNQWCIATRGSFESRQAIEATKLLNYKYLVDCRHWDPKWTFLFEYLAPWNRIVVNYGEEEDLYFLAAIKTESGKECGYCPPGFKTPKKFNCHKIEDIYKGIPRDNFEGVVVRFLKSGLRVKVKTEEYVRLHRLITGLNDMRIWECLKDRISLDLGNIPDELYRWIISKKNEFVTQYQEIEQYAKDRFYYAKLLHKERWQFAGFFKDCYWKNQPISSILFLMLDQRDYSEKIWKMLKPKGVS